VVRVDLTGGGPFGVGQLPLLLVGVSAAILGAVGVGWWYRRQDVPGVPEETERARPDDREPASEPEPTATPATQPAGTEDIVSNEDEIERLLDEHGGRMRQAEIVDALGWSKSKVSRVISSMADDGRVRKIRLGRENLIVLPGSEPEGATTPQ
jgi:hypothetical protein